MTQNNDTEQQVLDLENRRFQAMVDADIAALESIFADDLSYTHSTAALDTKESFIGSLSSGALKYESMTPSNMQVRDYGGTAVVTGNADVRVVTGGQQIGFSLRFTDVVVRRDGRWQVVAWHATRLPE